MGIWAFGAALLLLCCALIWSERLSVLRTVPSCAKCGYDVQGLPRDWVCPECGGRERKFSKDLKLRREASRSSVALWAIPTVCGLIATTPLVMLSKAAPPENMIAIAGNTATFIACGVMVRVMLGWITIAAARTILWCCMASMAVALAVVTLDAMYAHNINATAPEVLLFSPALIAPFAGYGVVAGILIHANRQAHFSAKPRRAGFSASA
jgi:hypothetical protein